MKELREDIRNNKPPNFPFFIKGNGQAKVFVPGVVTDKKMFDFYFVDVKDEEPILLSRVVNFVSEYRCYVLKGKIVGIKHYNGDIFISRSTSAKTWSIHV